MREREGVRDFCRVCGERERRLCPFLEKEPIFYLFFKGKCFFCKISKKRVDTGYMIQL